MEVRPLTISRSAWLKDASWFSVGHRLLQDEARFDRDYLLPVPGHVETFKPREMRYEEFVGRMRWILSGLVVNDAVLGEEVAMGLTAHSWRSFLPSAATAIGLSRELVDSLPAWGAQGGEGYVRTARQRSRYVQVMVARSAKDFSGVWDVFASGDDVAELARNLTQRVMTAETVQQKTLQWMGDVGAYRGPVLGELATGIAPPPAGPPVTVETPVQEPARKQPRLADARPHLP